MSDAAMALSGPDRAAGVQLSSPPDGAMLFGHAHGEPVLLARRGNDLFAIGALCTHYGGPLRDEMLVDDSIRCPWQDIGGGHRLPGHREPAHGSRGREGNRD